MRDWLRRVPYPFEVRMPNFPTSTSSSPTHRMRPSRDVPRRSQPYGLSPLAKTRMSPARHTNTPLRGYTNMQCVDSPTNILHRFVLASPIERVNRSFGNRLAF